MATACPLSEKKCVPCEGGVPALPEASCRELLADLPGWALVDGAIAKDFRFKDHYVTQAFVNAVAWISHRTDHHPDLTVGYRDCRVVYRTHAIAGLSENDFICAAKVERLFDL